MRICRHSEKSWGKGVSRFSRYSFPGPQVFKYTSRHSLTQQLVCIMHQTVLKYAHDFTLGKDAWGKKKKTLMTQISAFDFSRNSTSPGPGSLPALTLSVLYLPFFGGASCLFASNCPFSTPSVFLLLRHFSTVPSAFLLPAWIGFPP